MKKLLLLLGACVLLVGCGSSEKPTETTPPTTAEQPAEAVAVVSAEFVGSVYEGSNGIYEFTGYEFMDGAYGDKILALTMNYTNTTSENQNPWFAFATNLKGEQETAATVELLMGANGQFPDDYKPEAVKMSDLDIKPGATVEAVVGFTLADPASGVYVRSFFDDGAAYEFYLEQ